MLGCAQTGTGKTAAFALPVLQSLSAGRPRGPRRARALVLSPTRELAGQIRESFQTYGAHTRVRSTTVFGGVSERPQIRALERGVDVIVACPGRLLDLLGRGFVDLSGVEHLVLDEADRMLDMGFIKPIRRILSELPRERQNLLFSATLPHVILSLAEEILSDPVRVEVAPEEPTVEAIEQTLLYLDKGDKKRVLLDFLAREEVKRAIVFTRTKRGANRLAKKIDRAGHDVIPVHGNKSQNARRRAIEGFRDGVYDVLVATDVAARGLDIDDVTHVFNFDLPDDPASYVHRIGRTGRAGRDGVAISFCDDSVWKKLREIEKIIGQPLPADTDHPDHCEAAVPTRRPSGRGGRGNSRRSKKRGSRRRSRSGRSRR